MPAPLLERLARRYLAAEAFNNPHRRQARILGVMRDAEEAGITHTEIEAEMARLTSKEQ